MATAVNEANFEEIVLKSEVPVLVDFWAEWCGPCKALGPSIDELSTEFEGKAKVVKLDVDANQETSIKYGVMNIPALLVFKNGQEVERTIGNQPKGNIKALIERHL